MSDIELSPLDQTASTWFSDFHNLNVASLEFVQHQSSVANALGYDLEVMTQQDIEDLSTIMSTLALFGAMHDESNDFRLGPEEASIIRRVTRGIVRDVLNLAYTDQKHEPSYYDRRTGALNEAGLARYLRRRYDLDDTGQRERATDAEGGNGIEVVIGDGDLANFKRINTVLGDAVGDQALQEAYDELSEALRFSDDFIISRYRPGDEFEVILPNLDPADQGRLEERLLEAQLRKVVDNRYINAWSQIYQLRQQLIEVGLAQLGRPAPATVEVEDIDGVPTRVLYIAGQRMMALRDIVVHSMGFVRGRLGSWEDHELLHEQAKEAGSVLKDKIHDLMGGSDRPDPMDTE